MKVPVVCTIQTSTSFSMAAHYSNPLVGTWKLLEIELFDSTTFIFYQGYITVLKGLCCRSIQGLLGRLKKCIHQFKNLWHAWKKPPTILAVPFALTAEWSYSAGSSVKCTVSAAQHSSVGSLTWTLCSCFTSNFFNYHSFCCTTISFEKVFKNQIHRITEANKLDPFMYVGWCLHMKWVINLILYE